ncbi:LysR substrate-binding domain-containing protein [Magnetospirillum sp. 64-120]|uniref:LysR substrate-binding domain-containing protein n=1 Tax=Magnetospirillum sp. 64-120 TaxID=1895778 RepID=UPI00092B1FA0|nr:LysR substrate-binding domain-containing protein [Magnetospirillum sp. 64-120]OJX67121.1 MAG: LysR family transcriptional regulator [Magnetospirillum sp. 64-120]
MRFDPADLRLFLNVVLTGSIGAGAERSHLSAAAASTRLRGMEEALGTRLLERKRRGVETTAAGRVLEGHARLILSQLDSMQAELSEYAQGRRGRIRLMCNTVTLVEFLPQALGPFLAAHPEVDVDIEEQPSRRIVAAIADGLADIGIAAYAVATPRLETRLFRHDRLVVVAAPGHPLADRAAVAFAEVLDHDLVGLGADSAIQDLLTSHAAQAGRPMRLRTRLRTFAGICELAALGVGAAVVPQAAAQRAKARVDLTSIPLTDPWASRDLMVCVKSHKVLPPLVKALLDTLATPTP